MTTMTSRAENVNEKAARLIAEHRVIRLADNLYGVEGDHGTYLVALVPAGAARAVFGTGRVPPNASCTCLAAKVEGVVCSHISAARTLDLADTQPTDPFADL